MNDHDQFPAAEITVKVSDVKENLRLHRLDGREGLGTLFEYRVDLVNWDESDVVRNSLTPGDCLGPQALLGKDLAVTLPLAGEKTRTITGLVTQAAFRESIDHHTAYAVTIRPALWLLTLSENCRVFQDKTVPEVLEQILKEHGIGSPREALSRQYRTWDTLTQYRESDFAFVSRLLAREGLYYFFEHSPQGHTLVLADSPGAHREHPDFKTVAMGKPKPIAGSDEHLSTWQPDFHLQSEVVTLADFDFRLRRQSARILESGATGEADGAASAAGRPPREVYDFPARSVLAEDQEEATGEASPSESRAEAAALTRVRREAKRCLAARHLGQGTVRWLAPGLLFSVEGCEAQTFLAVETKITLRNPAFLTSETTIDEPCEIAVNALDSTMPFRLLPVDKPRILGPQTAWVVGERDEEIWTDKYGRVQVHFHWDRERASEQGSSCWVRVAQPWAGHHGGVFGIPRVGSEVVVEFLYGDPDLPLVTGSLYGGENLPPYDLPQHKTRSGIRTHSSKGASAANYNEIRFEDKKGQEELHIQAERNLSALVKHDQIVHVDGRRDITVKNGDHLQVAGSDKSAQVEGGYEIHAKRLFNLLVGAGPSCSATAPTCCLDLREGEVALEAANAIKLVCGNASMSLKQDGTIEISGAHIKLTGSDEIESEGKGARLSLNEAIVAEGAQVSVTGRQKLHLDGGKAKLDLDDKAVVIEGQTIELN